MATQLDNLLRLALGDTRFQPTRKRVRVMIDGEVAADGLGVLVWEPRRVVPTYSLRDSDVIATLDLADVSPVAVDRSILYPSDPFSAHTSAGQPLDVVTNSGRREAAAFALTDPDVAGLVAFDFGAFDWLEEDEEIFGHPRDPFHRIDIRRGSRTVRVEAAGVVLAESSRALALFETSIPVVRYYFPPDDVTVELTPTDTNSYCAYKGSASYFSATAAGTELPDVAWAYPDPLVDATVIGGLIAFYQERLEVFVDGQLQGGAD
ncbi:DUF427 domain-containing protein [Gordonia sp. CPCC 205333]|uniref:DUF427 domain-containing protein n=1 Tax=Gordonia sp. CPCC 205333 TaxID=3140790 RepID=UPI003AF33637